MSVEWIGNHAKMGYRNLGYIDGDTFRSRRNRAKHLFRKFNGFAISSELLDDLKQRGVERIELRVTENNGSTTKLMSSVNTWEEHGIDYQHPQFEPQLILNLSWFDS